MQESGASTDEIANRRALLGWLLAACCWLTAFAAGLLAPILPKMVRQFADLPHVEARVSLVATAPALAVALVALLTGCLGDRLGHRRVLLAGLAIYTVAGTAPILMHSLDAIIASRFVMGIGEATAMAMSSALVALCFEGAQRARWLSIQVMSSNVVGLLILLCGGLLGRLGWRAPFAVYALPVVLLVLAIRHVPRPVAGNTHGVVAEPWTAVQVRGVAVNCLLLMFATMSIGTLIVDFAFLFDRRGVTDPAAIGALVGAGGLGLTLGTILGGLALRLPRIPLQATAFLLVAAGFVGASLSRSPAGTAAWGALAGLGTGAVIPPLFTHTMAIAPRRAVGLVSGLWTTGVFVGQFLGPIGIVLLQGRLGSIDPAIRCAGLVALLVAAGVVVAGARRPAGKGGPAGPGRA